MSLNTLPADLYNQVLPYTNRATVASLTQISSNNHLYFQAHQEEFYISSTPLLHLISEHSNLVPKFRKNYKDRLPILDSYVQFAIDISSKLSELVYAKNRHQFGFADLFKNFYQFVTNHSDQIQLVEGNPDVTIEELILKTNTISEKDLFLAAWLLDDKPLATSFQPHEMDPRIIDFGAYFALRSGCVEKFSQMLPFTSICQNSFSFPFNPGQYPIWSSEVINIFLTGAVEINSRDVFKSLLRIEQPYAINTALIYLAKTNQREAITILLAHTDHTITTTQYLVTKGYANLRLLTHPPQISQALNLAILHNSLEAFQAILDGRPGNAISQEILENLKEQIQTANHLVNLSRRHLFLWILENEIAQRYGQA